jgi:hypothetical protein
LPTGTYNSEIRTTKTAPCEICPEGRSTFQTGGKSINDCSICVAGYGGDGCATKCGGGRGVNATYGGAGREETDCTVCAPISSGFTFYYRGQQSAFTPEVVSRVGAQSQGDCLAEFAQLADAAWFKQICWWICPARASGQQEHF